jgi:hypothetical protein
MRSIGLALAALIAVATCLAAPPAWSADGPSTYVGIKKCSECHPKQAATFHKYAKKAHSSRSITIMAPKLTPDEIKECFACHTTGYGKPGGFRSFEETPELADAGCEVCHGPGSAHAESGGDPSLIRRRLDIKDCETCHRPDRVKAFNYKPLLFGGAH